MNIVQNYSSTFNLNRPTFQPDEYSAITATMAGCVRVQFSGENFTKLTVCGYAGKNWR